MQFTSFRSEKRCFVRCVAARSQDPTPTIPRIELSSWVRVPRLGVSFVGGRRGCVLPQTSVRSSWSPEGLKKKERHVP